MRAWRSVQVLAAACCAAVGAGQARAQPLPNAGPVPEAVPYMMAPPSGGAPGYAPSMAPQGCPPAMPTPNLSEAMHEAPQIDCGWRATGGDADGWYLYTGAMGLKRNAPPSFPITTLDPGVPTAVTQFLNVPVTYLPSTGGPARAAIVPVTVTVQVATHPDTGAVAPPGSPTFGDFHDANPGYDWGYRMTLGCRMDDYAFEFSGFYLFSHGNSLVVSSNQLSNVQAPPIILSTGPITVPFDPLGTILSIGSLQDAVNQANPAQTVGRLNLPFFNAPAGFGGNNGLWLQADQAIVHTQSALGNFEFTTKYWAVENDMLQFQILGGLRYVDVKEKFGILTQDNVLLVGPSPTLDANYVVQTGNHMLLGQLGCDAEVCLGKLLSLDFMAKGAWGVNFIDSEVSLTRGDGLVGFDETRHTTGFSQLYEMGLFGQVCVTPHIRFKAGYETMWVLGVAEAYDQADYDLSHHTGRNQNNGSIFYHGPVMEMQIHF